MNLKKWVKIILGSLTGLVLLAVATIYGVSSYRLNRDHPVPELPKLAVSNNSDVLARGGHIATRRRETRWTPGAASARL